MQTINNRMTETQIADLFSLAVKLQVKAEESDDRDTAILAYSIQNACSNLTESKREFRAADATIHNLELKLTDMAVQLANAESKCRELAVECKTLSRFISGSCYVFDGDHDDDMPDEFIDASHYMPIVTPATDAFLAEVRASARNDFIGRIEWIIRNECNPDKTEAIINELQNFSDELKLEAAQ
ncbi:hypothetical protein VC562_12660 [Citrobacter freundii]|uniref:hypothetical protein n=1 Tax=Citrobacter freundii TaxID=546 RepID=UPI00292C8ED4|nr:hypothetical protein [Citrobacter freundii]MEB0407190.1 hypothetical protein [Citrobacter freundii]